MALSQAAIQTAFQNVLQRPASTSELNSYFAASQSGALNDSQVYTAIITSPEAAAGTFAVTRFYQAAFGRVPDQSGLDQQVDTYNVNGNNLKAIATGFTQATEFTNRYGTDTTVTVAYLQALYVNVLGRTGSSAEIQNWLNAVATPGSGYANRADVLFGFAQSSEFTANSNTGVVNFLTAAAQGQATYTGSLQIAGNVGITTALTTSVDNLVGGNGNDTFNALVASANPTLTGLDKIDGGAGNDTLNIVATSAYATPSGITVSNVETVNGAFTLGGTISTASGSGFTGVTQLSVQNTGGSVSLTADATTNEAVTNTAAAATNTTVLGGRNVAVTVTGSTTGQVAVGSATAGTTPVGTVSVNVANTVANTGTGGTINVFGGTTVGITSTQSGLAGTNGTATLGAIGVTGTAATTSVSVTQSAATTAAAAVTATANTSNAVAAQAGLTNGAVTIADANAGSTTVANTINSVTLANYGASTVSSTALNTLSLSGTGGTLGITTGGSAAQIAANTTLGLTLGGGNLGVITDASNQFATVNTALTANTTLAGITDTALRTLNLSGTGVLNLTAVNGAVTAINQTGAVGLTADVSGVAGITAINAASTTGAQTLTLNAATQSFTGGSGRDVISIGGTAQRAITGGSGTTDQIVLTANGSNYANFTNVTGFEQLGINALGTTAYNAAAISGINRIEVINAATTTITGITAGTGLQLDAATTSVTYQLAGTNGANSSVAVNLQGTTVTAANGGGTAGYTTGALVLQDANGVGIGNVSINSDASVFQGLHTVSALTDPNLSSLAITGTGSLSITAAATSSTSLTLSDNGTGTSATADGIVTLTSSNNALGNISYSGTHAFTVGTLADNVANLTVTNANTGTAGVLTIGTHTDNNLVNLTLNGSVAYTGSSSFNGVGSVSASTDNAAINITMNGGGVKTITLGNGANTVVTGAANDVITTGTGASTITGAAGADKITFGTHTGIDTINLVSGTTATGGDSGTFTAPGAGTNQVSTTTFDIVTGLKAGDHIQFTGGYTGNAGAAAGLVANGTAANSVAALTTVDNGVEIVRGTYSSGTNTFVGSATGADSLFVYDSAATVGSQAHEAVVLVGYVAQSVTGIGGNAGLVTLA